MTRLTESEFWTAVADYMEATGEMVPHVDGVPTNGLCIAVQMALNEGAISPAVKGNARRRIHDALAFYGRRAYLAPPGMVAPRIAWARKFAEESKRWSSSCSA